MTTERKEQIEWSGSTPLVKVLENGWKDYPIDDFHSEFIVTIRMRGYAMEKDSISPDGEQVIKKEDLQIHTIFFPPPKKGEKVFQPA